MTKIKDLNMTTADILFEMSEGNPGALTVMLQMLERGDQIDPDGVLGGLGCFLLLDTFKIYGSRIWVLSKDVCGHDMVKTIGMLRAVQLGLLNEETLNRAIDGPQHLNTDVLLAKVQKRLPNFGKTADA